MQATGIGPGTYICSMTQRRRPDRTIIAVRGSVEEVAGAPWAVPRLELAFAHHQAQLGQYAFFRGRRSVTTADHPLQKGELRPFRVGIAEPGAPLLVEQFLADFHPRSRAV